MSQSYVIVSPLLLPHARPLSPPLPFPSVLTFNPLHPSLNSLSSLSSPPFSFSPWLPTFSCSGSPRSPQRPRRSPPPSLPHQFSPLTTSIITHYYLLFISHSSHFFSLRYALIPLKTHILLFSLSLPFSFLLCDSFSLPSAPLRPPSPSFLRSPRPLLAPGLSVPVFCSAVTCVCQPQALAGEVPRLPHFFPNLFFSFRGVVCRVQVASLFGQCLLLTLRPRPHR